ncbi:MAG: hypothetical protein P8J33_14065 [Pirellulaceae bacterium]|nr:hypothetical protein [Pirellulaceae bacterium]
MFIILVRNGLARSRRSFCPALDKEFTSVGSSCCWSCYVTPKWLTASNTRPRDDVFVTLYCENGFGLLRRTTSKATRKDENRCKGYAVWGGEYCVFHGGKPLCGTPGENRMPVCNFAT